MDASFHNFCFFPCLFSARMLLPLKDITTTAEDTWGEWTTPEECTIKTEDTKAEFQKTDAFMTTAVVIREGKAPMVGTTTKAEDTKVE